MTSICKGLSVKVKARQSFNSSGKTDWVTPCVTRAVSAALAPICHHAARRQRSAKHSVHSAALFMCVWKACPLRECILVLLKAAVQLLCNSSGRTEKATPCVTDVLRLLRSDTPPCLATRAEPGRPRC
eukprot:2661024-Pleurochrysis_carterae.AAC.1